MSVENGVPAERGGGASARKSGPLAFDTSVAHQARMYDYVLGGKDNYAADRAAVEAGLKVWPDMAFAMRANRAFLGRAVRYLAGDAGMRQFLDIGTGIPTAGNTHEIVQAMAPDSRVVYVDYDPVVLAHARATRTRSWPRPPNCSTSASPWRSRCSPSSTRYPTRMIRTRSSPS